MLGAIYTGLSGMTAYSRGLDLISNNVANLNTPGFKLSKPIFSDIERQAGDSSLPESDVRGAGVSVDVSQLSFKAGELRSTGNSLDAAIDGNGFFVLDRNGEQVYTRAGQFEFDKDGFLVEKTSGANVMVRTENNAIQSFNINSYRAYAPKATTAITLTGNLARTGTTSGTYTISSVTTVDTTGGTQTLQAKFVRDATDPLLWTAELLDANNNSLGTGQIQFAADGTPAADQAPLTFTVKPTGLPEYTVTLNIGDAGSYGGLTSTAASTTSSAQVLKQDGVEVGSLTDTSFDETGRVKLTYSNGESLYPATLLLANFEAPDRLTQLGGSLFAASNGQAHTLNIGLQGGLGKVVGGEVELSNVDLTEQFTDLIIVQRGYQASSQTMSVANEMLQQLLSMQSGR
jgi:flagellar hook protein FlgE